jgi:hypothetical protein
LDDRAGTQFDRFEVIWRVHPPQDLIQLSGVMSGLAALARRGVIDLRVSHADRPPEIPYPVMELTVRELRTNRTRTIALDFYDREDLVVPAALEPADRYFKRQCGPRTRAVVGGHDAEKIRPMGLTVAGISLPALRLVASAVYSSLRSKAARRSFPTLRALFDHAMSDVRLGLLTPSPDSYATWGHQAKSPGIVFQPRVWATEPGSENAFGLANAARLATVRALKSAFPQEEAIGLVHSAAARDLANDLLLSSHVTMEEHHRLLQSKTIGVNCPGLSDSVGWKFAEYLAAGNAIVSQRIEKELLAPIQPDIHYLPYRDPEECVVQCRRLLSDPALAARMGTVNLAYYRRWVDPPSHVMTLLHQAFE